MTETTHYNDFLKHDYIVWFMITNTQIEAKSNKHTTFST
jgi:hypothetical protein